MGEASIAIGATARAGIAGVSRLTPRTWAALAAACLIGLTGRYLGAAWILPADFVAAALAYGALYRAAFDGPAGLVGLRCGREEVLIAGVQLLLGLVFLVVTVVLLVLVGAVALGVARAAAPGFDATSAQAWRAALSGPLAAFVTALAPLASLAILAWLAARLALAPAASIAAGRLQVLSAFDLTKGRAGLLVVLGLVFYLPSVLIAVSGQAAFDGLGAGLVQVAALGLYYFCVAPAWTAACVHVYRHAPSLAVAQPSEA
ncbi:hypothetical protein AS593_17210 [Caulobacter vibrioides]|nr:hypothetical protein AS593_17210 [Caulobacter vibrioides]